MNFEKLFVTGIGTEVGKTVASTILSVAFDADYWKPVQSGDLHQTDSMVVENLSAKQTYTHPEIYRFQLAASPHHSAAKENVLIDPEKFILPKTGKNLVVEGAGGLMVPLAENFYVADLAKKLQIPIAVVVKDYLGCINHSLATFIAIRHYGLDLKCIVLNGPFNTYTETAILDYNKNVEVIRISELKNLNPQNIYLESQKIKYESTKNGKK